MTFVTHRFFFRAIFFAGRLNFANQRLFRRLGRAMIKPVYAQASSKSGIVGARLRESLQWWLRVLCFNVCEDVTLKAEKARSICRLFVDAASTPAHCAAVLFRDSRTAYTNAAPSVSTVNQLKARGDKQITSLVCCHDRSQCVGCSLTRFVFPPCQEILSIYLGLVTFADELEGRRVVLYSDNQGASCLYSNLKLAHLSNTSVQVPSTRQRKAHLGLLITTRSFTKFGRYASRRKSTFGSKG